MALTYIEGERKEKQTLRNRSLKILQFASLTAAF